MASERIAVIDLETTGLSPWRYDRVVEIAIVVISKDGTICAEYETLVNPKRDIGPSRIHQISAADVLEAPTFADIAGDVLEIIASADALAGHNVSFDKNFLVKEYERVGVVIPELPLLCTWRLFGRNSLGACCRELGIPFEGMPHRALSDARATARLVAVLASDDSTLIEEYRLRNVSWPTLVPLRTGCFPREHARLRDEQPPRFLQRLAAQIHHDMDAETSHVLDYMSLIDRVLEDRIIDATEEETLVDAALHWRLSSAQIHHAHLQYLHRLAVAALRDGSVSEYERRDLREVARLLGQDASALDAILESASTQLQAARCDTTSRPDEAESLRGKRVCFTGELRSTLGGQPITRELAEALASDAGLHVVSGVTKKLDLLVVADPNTQSTKAKKARDYGIRILSEAVFWRMIGAAVD